MKTACAGVDCMIDQGVDAICILAIISDKFLLSDDGTACR